MVLMIPGPSILHIQRCINIYLFFSSAIHENLALISAILVKGTLEGMSQRMKLLYFTGSCHDNVQAQDQIKSNFITVMNKYLQKTGQGSCSDPGNNNICLAENIRISCGQVQSRKRSTQVVEIN